MNSNTNAIFTGMKILTWIFFIGLCIKTGTILVNTIINLIPQVATSANNWYLEPSLSGLPSKDKWEMVMLLSLVIFVTGLRAYLCYWVIMVFKKLDLVHPFSEEIGKYISNISCVALTIGLFNYGIKAYEKYLSKNGINFDNSYINYEGASEFIFFAGVIYVIALVYKKGIELQSDNELTV